MVTPNKCGVNGFSGFPLPVFDGASLDGIRSYLESIRDKAFIVGNLALQAIPTMHRVVAELIWINVSEPGAIYPTGKDDRDCPAPVWSLGNKSLKRLARAADLSWDAHQSRRIDDGRDPDIRSQRRVCRVRELDGSTRVIAEEYTLDLRVREQELIEAKLAQWYWKRGPGLLKNVEDRIADNIAKAKKDSRSPWSKEFCDKLRAEVQVYPETDREPWAREQARIEMLTIRKFADQRAVTGAESRCIVAALALSRGGYYLSDLTEKPFVVLKLVADIDYRSDPIARRMLVAMTTGLVDAAYGHGRDLAGLFDAPAPAPVMIAAPVSAEDDLADPDVYESPEDADPVEVAHEEVEAAEVVRAEPVQAELAAEVPVSVQPPVTAAQPFELPDAQAFAKWPRETQVKLLLDLRAKNPNLPKVDLTAAADAGIVRYYDVCLRYLKADQERRRDNA